MLGSFDKKASLLQKTFVAESSRLFDDLSSIANRNVIEKQQQAFLSEIKQLADSMRGTVLDRSEQVVADKVDKKTRVFLQEVIRKEIKFEKIKLEKQHKIDMEEVKTQQADSRSVLAEQQSEKQIAQKQAVQEQAAQKLASQVSLSELVKKKQRGKMEYSQAQTNQADIAETENKHTVEENGAQRKLPIEQKNNPSLENVKNSVSGKNSVVYSLKNSINEVEERLTDSQREASENEKETTREFQEKIQNETRIGESQAQLKKQQIQRSIYSENIAESNKRSIKALKELVADKSTISKVLQRQDDMKEHQTEAQVQTQTQAKDQAQRPQNFTMSSGNKNSPLAGMKSGINPLNNPLKKVVQAVNQTMSEISTSVNKQLESTSQSTSSAISGVETLMHKLSVPTNPLTKLISQMPANAGLLNTLVNGKGDEGESVDESGVNDTDASEFSVGKSTSSQSINAESGNSKPIKKQSKGLHPIVKSGDEQSHVYLDKTIAQVESTKFLNKIAKKETSQIQSLSQQHFSRKLEAVIKTTKESAAEKNISQVNFEETQQDFSTELSSTEHLPAEHSSFEQSNLKQMDAQQLKSAQQKNGSNSAISEELQTAVQWMAEEEVENKLVDLLSRQARLRGIDLS